MLVTNEIKFESYYGYPDASHFKLVNNTQNDNYFEVHTT